MRFNRTFAKAPSSFEGELNASKGIVESCDVADILRLRIPGCLSVTPTDAEVDRSGVDWIATLQCRRSVGIDVKYRRKDCRAYGNDDLALETWSVVGSKPGWTRDVTKACEWILWVWGDTGRFCMIPFLPLCCVFESNWHSWALRYGLRTQQTSRGATRWQSECVFVPRKIVVDSVVEWCNGELV